MLTRAREALDGLLAAVLAPPCVVCGRVAERPTDGAACESLLEHHPIHHPAVLHLLRRALALVSHAASGCAAFTVDSRVGAPVRALRGEPPLVDAARALGPYEGTPARYRARR